jgi:hypothetical protein
MATLQESLIDTLTAGRGNSAVATNTAFGENALKLNTSAGVIILQLELML